ncbi:glycosyltransferase family 2 protein [Nocardioides ferulae]|uniref:glycosyltransferase family 2 protein n=1 Tax=Nocardioides ferulae TaxID=2340821 RepID=UPI0013DDE7D7|nr:glycosyltransferase family A protein [Nocardioides ferulae]
MSAASPARPESPVDVAVAERPLADAPRHDGVSVLIATRDRLPTLRRALAAVWAQTYPGPMQVVVVFDGPRPDRLDLPAPLRPDRQRLEIRTNQRAPGVAGARNTGLATVRHRHVATCDDDDVWLPHRLEAQLAVLAAEQHTVAVGGSVRVQRHGRSIVRRAPLSEVRLADLLEDRIMELHPSAMLYRTSALEAIGGWDETIPGGYAEDYDLLLKLAQRGPIRLVDEVTADIHWDGGSYFFSRWRMVADALTLLLDRYPEFAGAPRGRARIEGQIAFALAAAGDRAGSRVWLERGLQDNPREPRLALTRLVLAGLVRAELVQRVLHARGRGI